MTKSKHDKEEMTKLVRHLAREIKASQPIEETEANEWAENGAGDDGMGRVEEEGANE
jgi:hypothetical protein